MTTSEPLLNCSDEELLTRFRQGRREAFEVLLRRYERELFGYLQRYLRDSEMAADVFQNTFLQLYLKADSYDACRRLRPWLYTIASHQAIDALRRNGRHNTVRLNAVREDRESGEGDNLIDALESSCITPPEAAENNERCQAVRAAVDQLPDFLRQVVILGYYQGLRYQEIADIMGIPLGTVKSRLHTAMQRLQELLPTLSALSEAAIT